MSDASAASLLFRLRSGDDWNTAYCLSCLNGIGEPLYRPCGGDQWQGCTGSNCTDCNDTSCLWSWTPQGNLKCVFEPEDQPVYLGFSSDTSLPSSWSSDSFLNDQGGFVGNLAIVAGDKAAPAMMTQTLSAFTDSPQAAIPGIKLYNGQRWGGLQVNRYENNMASARVYMNPNLFYNTSDTNVLPTTFSNFVAETFSLTPECAPE